MGRYSGLSDKGKSLADVATLMIVVCGGIAVVVWCFVGK